MPKEFWTIDCETDPFLFGRIPRPFLWGAYKRIGMKEIYHEFQTTADLYNFMKDKNELFFAHNGGKFDFHYLADYLEKEEKLLMINARLVQAKIGKAEIRDSYALLPFPLRQIGGKLDIDYKKLEKKVRHKHMAEISEYMKADCVALYDAIEAFFTIYGRHLTSASAAIKTLMKYEELKIENSGSFFFEEFNKHYFGGRCECIRGGSYNEELTYLDINSAYPFAMLHDHPISLDWEFEYEENPEIKGHNFYSIRAISNGALCRRTKEGLIFDRDGEEREYHTTGWEIIAGLQTGTLEIKTHISQKVFANTKNFSKFINYFWEERQKHAKGTHENLFAKLFMNSAYGKFAANPENYDTYVLFDPAIAEYLTTEDWEIRGELGENVLCSKPLEADYMRYYNVATGASITGFVRALLLRAINSVDNPIYCDTDSLVFTGKHDIKMGDQLGQWKIEGIYSEGHFAGKKLYAVKNKDEEKIASKGTKLTFTQIKEITQGKTENYQFEAPTFSWLKKTSFTQRKIRNTACITT